MRQRYPEYRESGVDRLGKVPAHWRVARLKDAGRLMSGNAFPETLQGDPEQTIPFYKVADLEKSPDAKSMPDTENTISPEAASQIRARIIPRKAITYAKIGEALNLNRRRIIGAPACIDNNMSAYVPNERVVTSLWAFYCLCNINFREFVNPGAVPSLSEGDQAGIYLLIPPLSEQAAIVAFLDRETARIDQLIARHELLIERLAEYRNAVITRAVTKGLPADAARDAGLDPEPRMKSSGSEWIGEVPEHWDVKKLKQSATRTNIKAETEDLEDITYIGLENVRPWTGSLEKMDDPIEAEGTANVFRMGDVLFGKLRPYLAKGLLAANAGVCSTEFLVVTPTDYEGQYLLYIILTDGFIRDADSSTFGAKMPRTNWDFIGNRNLPIPPRSEQRAIAQYLDQKTASIDALSERAATAIERLNEYRTALITAAVTGKIDVREPSADAAEEPTE